MKRGLALSIVVLLVACLALVGCRIHGPRRGYLSIGPLPAAIVVETAPPAIRVEPMPPRPSPAHVWIPGYWNWAGRWVWVPGRYAYGPKPSAVWRGARTERRGGRLYFAPGHWTAPKYPPPKPDPRRRGPRR